MKRLICALISLMLVLSCFAAAESAILPVVYGKVTSANGAASPLYQLPNDQRPVLKNISNGAAIMILFEGTVWHKIQVTNTGDVGWMKAGEITITTRGRSALTYGASVTSAKTIKSSDGFAALRWGPGLEYDAMDQLPAGLYCWVYERVGDWSRVLLEDGRIGYVHSTLLQNASKMTTWPEGIKGYVQVSGNAANYRSDANYSSKVLGTLASGHIVDILGEKNSFFYFYSESLNKYGYISIDIMSPEGLNRVAYLAPLYYDHPYNYNADVLWELNAGQVVKVLANDGYVSRVQYDNVIGYIDNNDLVIHH